MSSTPSSTLSTKNENHSWRHLAQRTDAKESPSWEDIERWHQENLGRKLVIEDLRKPLIAPRVHETMTILNKIGIAIELIRETNILNLESEMLAKHKWILVV